MAHALDLRTVPVSFHIIVPVCQHILPGCLERQRDRKHVPVSSRSKVVGRDEVTGEALAK